MKRILIFDDDPDILELCALILREKGYEVKGLRSCRDVIAKFIEFEPDLILMDIWIPDTGGVEATGLLKNTEVSKHIPVILFSASNDLVEKAREAKADFYLKKPFDMAELENLAETAINSCHEKKGDHTPSL